MPLIEKKTLKTKNERGPYKLYYDPENNFEKPRTTILSQEQLRMAASGNQGNSSNVGKESSAAVPSSFVSEGNEGIMDVGDQGQDALLEPETHDRELAESLSSQDEEFIPMSPLPSVEGGDQLPEFQEQDDDEEFIPTDQQETEQNDKWNMKHEWESILPLKLKRSKFEIMLEIFHLAMRHGSFNKQLIADLLKFVNTLFDQEVVPESLFLFNKLFSHPQVTTCHFFCTQCNTYFGVLEGAVSCKNCHAECEISGMNKGNFFISLSIRQQLEQLFKKPDIKVVPHLNRPSDVIADIMDGSIYRKLCEPGEILADECALSITFNTDGAAAFKSRAGSIWPIQFIVNEISPEQRFDYENVLMCGLWFGKRDPDMTFFLAPFIEEMNLLSTQGIQRKMEDGSYRSCPVYALSCSVDSVAKPKLQNIKQFNGHFGCGYCLHPNIEIHDSSDEEDEVDCPDTEDELSSRNRNKRKRKTDRRYCGNVTYPYRTHSSMKADMLRVDQLETEGLLKPPNDHVNGLKGISSLLCLLHFDIVFGFVIDYMHNTLSGCTQRLTELICKFLTDEKLRTLNKILAGFKPPQNILRRPRPLSERADFKCKEWRACLLFYFLPLFKDELPENVFENLSSFVIAVFILLKRSITREELEIARELLDVFVDQFNELYGNINMVYNIHLITHLVDIVEMWGPLWAYSAFTFESGNGEILKLLTGTSGVPTQICEKYSLVKSVHFYMSGRHVSKTALDFCSSIMNYNYVKQFCVIGSATAIGTSVAIDMTDEERGALISAGFEDFANSGEKIEYYKRVMLSNADGNPFYSAAYKRPNVYNDTCVQLTDYSYAVTEKFVILPFLQDNTSDLWVFVRPIQISADDHHLAPHIKTCAHLFAGSLKVINSSAVKCKAVYLSCKNKSIVMDFPNFFEKY